jgi:G3E family GTPase
MIKLFLLSGFLGAGKTTFLKSALEQLSNHKIGIIMNEFGRVSIDGPILDSEEVTLIELNRGSIFCSCLKLSFIRALNEMAVFDLDYVFVESSGLADPSNIAEILEVVEIESPGIYDYAGTICIVDAMNFMDQIEDIVTLKRQIECADIAIINKVDRISEEALPEIEALIRIIQPKIRVMHSAYFKLNFDFIEKGIDQIFVPGLRDSYNTEDNKPKTILISFSTPFAKIKLTRFLEAVSDSAYRIKGFVDIEEGRFQVDVVGRTIDYLETEKLLETSTLVVLSRIGPQIIRVVDQMWKAEIGTEMKMSN